MRHSINAIYPVIYREFEELFKNDLAFMFSRISFNILYAFSAFPLDHVTNFVKTIKKTINNDKMKKSRAYNGTDTLMVKTSTVFSKE